MGPNTTKFYTLQDAADLCGKSHDTIKRRRNAGAFPNARQRPGDRNGTWEIPLQDLVAAGLYELAPGGAADADESIRQVRDDRELVETRAELIRERAQREAMDQLMSELRRQVSFLEKTVAQLTKGGGR